MATGQERRLVQTPRGQLSSKQRACLRQHSNYLAREMEGKVMVQYLNSALILEEDDVHYILGIDGKSGTRLEQNERLLEKVALRTSRGFDTFLKGLQDTGHDQAYEKLSNTLYNLEETAEMQEDMEAAMSSESLTSTLNETLNSVLKISQMYNINAPPPPPSAVDEVKQVCQELCGRVEHVEKYMGVLSHRMTLVETNRQEEVNLMKKKIEETGEEIRELTKARGEIDRLRKENEQLNKLLGDKSKKLEEAEKKLVDLRTQLDAMSDQYCSLQKQFSDQEKTIQDMKLQSEQSRLQMKKEMDTQQLRHQQELDELRLKTKQEMQIINQKLSQVADQLTSRKEKVTPKTARAKNSQKPIARENAIGAFRQFDFGNLSSSLDSAPNKLPQIPKGKKTD